jgi:hypothetical protein
MSATICTSSEHLVANQLCAQGHFLICLDCPLRFEFPSGTPYLTVTRQFESQSCGSAPTLSSEDALVKCI